MAIILPDEFWQKRFARLSSRDMAAFLKATAQHAKLSRYRKNKRGPKKPKRAMNKKNRNHVSTAKVLKQRAAKKAAKR